tara:strand:- start:591 stop:878 length:288 start_codon:yes stop_codon:yes gene_type:complete
MNYSYKFLLFFTTVILVSYLNPDTASANFAIQENNNNQIHSNDYLDFSYISFVIQMIIGGAVAGAVALVAYYRKFSNFIFKLFNKNQNENKKNKD